MNAKSSAPVSYLNFLLAFICAFLSFRAAASEGPPPVLHITTYRSPSDKCAITVDPSRLHGEGSGMYRFERDGKLVWEKQLDFTFWEAAVSDDGIVVGYGYTNGWRGFSGKGEFIVAMLNPDGTTKFIDRRPRVESGRFHTPPDPTACGCFLDPSSSRFVVRFRNDDMNDFGERWEVYDVAAGKRLDDGKLMPPSAPPGSSDTWYFATEVQPVPETELTLVVWYRTQWEPRQAGIRLALLDRNAHEIWSVERPAEFASVERSSVQDIHGLKLLPPPTARSFVFRSPADQVRLTYSLVRAEAEPREWTVRESARVAEAVLTDLSKERSPLTPISLTSREVVTLQVGNDPDAQSLNVFEFDFDSKGRIGFVSRQGAEAAVFNLNSPDGKKEKAIPAAGRDASDFPNAVHIGEDRWVLFSCPPGDGTKPTASILDVSTGALTKIENFEAPHSYERTIKGSPGRFAILGDYRDQSAAIFDSNGKRLAFLPNPVFSAQDIAFNSRGELGALGGIRNQIAIFDKEGGLNRTIDLKATVGGLNYVSGLQGDIDGGWILHDFGGSPPIYRLDHEGKVIAKLTPRFPDGREFRLFGDVKRAPDGRLWTSDRASLLRLGDDGVVDLAIGAKPGTDSLGEVRCSTIDSRGNVYAVDAQNASVHVFDSQGRPLRVLKPDPTDFSTDAGLGTITVAADGAVYYMPTTLSMKPRGYLKLNADGSRAGFQKGISGEVVDEWHFRPGSQERLVLGYERAFLVDSDGRATKTLERRADRRWLDHPAAAAFAPDGTFVIFARPSNWGDVGDPSVTHFTREGEPLKTFDLPRFFRFPGGATNGKTIVAASGSSAVVIDIASGTVNAWSFPPEAENSWWEPFISPDGQQLWCIDKAARKVHRFAMP